MAKFDVFNSHTWDDVPVLTPRETLIANRAVGAIGQKIHELKDIYRILDGVSQKESSPDYVIAERLRLSNPEAYKIMDVGLEYSSAKVFHHRAIINSIFQIWGTPIGFHHRSSSDEIASMPSTRASNWRRVALLLNDIKDVYDEYHKNPRNFLDKMNGVSSVKVSGNAAWKVYLSSALDNKKLSSSLSDAKKRAGDDDSDYSIDDEDDDESEEDGNE